MVALFVRKWAVFSSLLLSLISPVVFADVLTEPPAQQTAAKQASPFALPITKRDSLLNGLQLIVMERQGTGTITTRLRINSGAMFDMAGKGGLAALTSDMTLKGGGGLNAKNIADTIEQLGMTLVHTVGWDTTEFIISGPAESLDSMFDLLSRAVVNPAFDQKELDALKKQRIESEKGKPADEGDQIKAKALEAVFGSHPFGKSVGGSAESIGQITRADLAFYHSRFYIANNAELMVSGDTTIEQITRLARSRLGSWKKGEVIPASFRAPDIPAAARLFIIDRPESGAARAAISMIGPSRRSDDYFAAMIMADAFTSANTKFASGEQGTAIETEIEPRMLPGPLLVKIKAPAADLTTLIQSVLEAMRTLQSKQPPIEEVEAAKARLIAGMAERLKTDDGVAQVILDIETYGLGRDYLIKFAERVNAVTPGDVQRAAQTYLRPQAATISISGPASKIEEQARKLGTVTVLR